MSLFHPWCFAVVVCDMWCVACGVQGRLAHVYADLVNDLWSPTKKTVTPKSFKNEIAKFNDLFGGHDQHDAQVWLCGCAACFVLTCRSWVG